MKTKKNIFRVLFLTFFTAIVFLLFFSFYNYFTFDMLMEHHEFLILWKDSNYTKTILIFTATFIFLVSLSLPGSFVMILVGGYLFDTFPGFFINLIGASLGAMLCFILMKTLLGRFVYSKLIKSKNQNILNSLNNELHKNEFNYLLIMRLMPMIPFFIGNLGPAFFGVKFSNYAITTPIGIFPGVFVGTTIGTGLRITFVNFQGLDLNSLIDIAYLTPTIGLIILALIPIFIKKFNHK
ncbi:VTT domain-containing protein [Amylibacter sp.]|nr:VTT domain-containing protein [Amylibacter sp.]MDB9740081.1 VTT domain-containing protein [Amylibacter sp.]